MCTFLVMRTVRLHMVGYLENIQIQTGVTQMGVIPIWPKSNSSRTAGQGHGKEAAAARATVMLAEGIGAAAVAVVGNIEVGDNAVVVVEVFRTRIITRMELLIRRVLRRSQLHPVVNPKHADREKVA